MSDEKSRELPGSNTAKYHPMTVPASAVLNTPAEILAGEEWQRLIMGPAVI